MTNDRDYFLSRAQEEEARAEKAGGGPAQEAHRQLAEYYRAVARNRGPRLVR